jgi:recA bacterial DNA recombination protein
MSTEITANPEKQKALNIVLTQIERSFGKGAIMRLGDATRMRVETIPSGSLTLDLALGGGTAQKAQVRRRLRSMRSPKFKKQVESPPLWTQNML